MRPVLIYEGPSLPSSQARYLGEEAGSVDGSNKKNIIGVGAVKAVGR